jgi:hypothetical protein
MVAEPMPSRPPSASTIFSMRCPWKKVPLRLPRSRTLTPSGASISSTWVRDTARSDTTMSHPGAEPTTQLPAPSRTSAGSAAAPSTRTTAAMGATECRSSGTVWSA